MPGREVRVKEVLKDIHTGMDEESLRKKYKLTSEGLKNLFKELSQLGLLERLELEGSPKPTVRIRIRDVVNDIRNGLDDNELRKKYQLSATGLHGVFKKLLELKAIDADALFGTGLGSTGGMGTSELRELERYRLDFDIPVYRSGVPDIHGRVRDVNERGVGIAGIRAREGERSRLVVLGDSYGFVGTFEFEAECRWSGMDNATGERTSGFLITDISEWDMEELRKLIRLLTLSD